MNRRTNTKKWRNTHTGVITESYEQWSLLPIKSIAANKILYAQDSMSGVPAPHGHLWVKNLVIHPPSGSWREVS